VPWRESCPMSERLLFVTRAREGERVSELAREFGISTKTAYKFLNRWQEDGAHGLEDRSHAVERIPHRTPDGAVRGFAPGAPDVGRPEAESGAGGEPLGAEVSELVHDQRLAAKEGTDQAETEAAWCRPASREKPSTWTASFFGFWTNGRSDGGRRGSIASP
jgi:transposase-like protein